MPLTNLIENNRHWSERTRQTDPEFFETLARQQKPEYLWIGCSDSRVPANEIVGLRPGEVFVHRNVANLVVRTDFNCLSVVEFAVLILKVKHIIVCGHYGCGGVKAALEKHSIGLIDNWLHPITLIAEKYSDLIAATATPNDRINLLCELNVIEQVRTLCTTSLIQNAWQHQQPLYVHGWIYGLRDGLIHDLHATVKSPDEIETAYHGALANLKDRRTS